MKDFYTIYETYRRLESEGALVREEREKLDKFLGALAGMAGRGAAAIYRRDPEFWNSAGASLAGHLGLGAALWGLSGDKPEPMEPENKPIEVELYPRVPDTRKPPPPPPPPAATAPPPKVVPPPKPVEAPNAKAPSTVPAPSSPAPKSSADTKTPTPVEAPKPAVSDKPKADAAPSSSSTDSRPAEKAKNPDISVQSGSNPKADWSALGQPGGSVGPGGPDRAGRSPGSSSNKPGGAAGPGGPGGTGTGSGGGECPGGTGPGGTGFGATSGYDSLSDYQKCHYRRAPTNEDALFRIIKLAGVAKDKNNE